MSSFRFIVMGDRSSYNEADFRLLLEKIKGISVPPHFILFVGDLIYGRNVSSELETWKNIVKDYFPIAQVFPAFGNHDKDESDFSDAFPHLPDQQLPGYRRTVYYFDVKNARFIVLNSDRKDDSGNYIIDSRQRSWLEQLIKNSGKTHHFVMFHVPAYPIGHHYGKSLDANERERDALWNILDKYNVTAVFVGHEHNYNRRLIDRSFSSSHATFNHHIYQLTIGRSGAGPVAKLIDSRNVKKGPFAVHHALVVDIFDGLAGFNAYDINGKRLDSFLVRRFPPVSDPSKEALISLNSVWKYKDDGSDQGEAWRNMSFNDSAWPSGPAELGYGDGDENTVISYGPDPANKPITVYFRKSFSVTDPSVYKSLSLYLLRDDGAVVYLNGQEVYRTNMPAGSIDYRSLASKGIYDWGEINFEKKDLNPGLLKKGTNVVAVEIHQANSSSSDMSFDLELIGNRN